MSKRTEARHLTREEGAGYCTALKDLRAWHESQIEPLLKRQKDLAKSLLADTIRATTLSLASDRIETHEAAIAEIDRLMAQRTARTFGQ